MSESALKIKRFERRVMWRNRLLSLQDNLSIALLAGGMLSAALVLYAKMRPVSAPAWLLVVSIFSLVIAAISVRWYLTRSTERDAAFRIDHSLQLDDRLTTARSIIERGGPEREIETTLIDDVAERLSDVRESSIVPYRFAARHALSFVGLIAIVVAVLVPQRVLPGGEELIAEQADVRAAGEQLEQVAQDVIRELPPEVETAQLAKEQAELGNALRRSSDTRAEALKKISELEGRIRQRHDYLSSTRADEIVSMAENRLRNALATRPKDESKSLSEASSESSGDSADQLQTPSDLKQANSKQTNPQKTPSEMAKNSGNANRTDQTNQEESRDKSGDQSSTQNQANRLKTVTANTNQSRSDSEKTTAKNSSREQSDKLGKEGQSLNGDRNTSQSGDQSQTPSVDGRTISGLQNDAQDKKEPDASSEKQSSEEKQSTNEPEKDSQPQTGLTGAIAEQAIKVVPKLSEQLLKNAEQLRADQIKPEDIRRLAQAAEQLARDLAPIAESEEFRKMAEQFARQIKPEQLEQMARELMKQEDLRKELQAAAKLLMESRQIKELAAGLSQRPDGGQRQDNGDLQRAGRGAGNQGGQGAGNGQGNQSNKDVLGRVDVNQPLTAKGKETRVGGNMQKRQGGEYLFLQSRPGSGAARAPYSSAYPRYRREAERSVERSQVPAHLRSLVRNYFDVINPDAGKEK